MFLKFNFKVDFLTSTCSFKKSVYCNKKVYDNILKLKIARKKVMVLLNYMNSEQMYQK